MSNYVIVYKNTIRNLCKPLFGTIKIVMDVDPIINSSIVNTAIITKKSM